jgi:hypothetical protein
MGKLVRAGWCGLVALGGCSSIPPLDNPTLVRPSDCEVENPVVVAPGLPTPEGYRDVYDRVLEVLNDYFVIKPGSRYSGQIETLPRIAPGYEQFWRPGSPDPRERLLATLQTVRHYAIVQIWAGERGGYRVYVEVYKEVEDNSNPVGARSGVAIFQEAPSVDRRVEVVAPEARDEKWIPAGREPAFEQVLLRKIQQSQCR